MLSIKCAESVTTSPKTACGAGPNITKGTLLGLVAMCLMVAAGVFVGTPAAFAGAYKTTICHVPPGNPENAHTITISDNALVHHLGDDTVVPHGGVADSLGECGSVGNDCDNKDPGDFCNNDTGVCLLNTLNIYKHVRKPPNRA